MSRAESLNIALDWIWPSVHDSGGVELGQSGADVECIETIPDDPSSLEVWIAEMQSLLDAEKERQYRAEQRMTGALGFSGVAGTLAIGLAGGSLTSSWGALPGPFKLVLGLAVLYVAAQLVRIALSSLGGLERASYLGLVPNDILPVTDKDQLTRRKLHLKHLVLLLEQHKSVNDRKLNAMAVAHRAMRNYLVGVALLGFLGLAAHMGGSHQEASELVRELRGDPQLIELLRGPQGPRGEKGPEGPQGPRGPQGPADPRSSGDQ